MSITVLNIGCDAGPDDVFEGDELPPADIVRVDLTNPAWASYQHWPTVQRLEVTWHEKTVIPVLVDWASKHGLRLCDVSGNRLAFFRPS